ncbi:MAG: MoxR family ATPase [Planctomycetes bacterium]|nr:MoxR family ATPase [Planctomycetota bacterium]
MADVSNAEIEKSLKTLQSAYKKLKESIHRVIVGQDEVIDQLLISLFCKGHSLLVGVPGLAKTMLIKSLARSLSLSFSRIQFTPDLMPADITGTEVIYEDKMTGKRNLEFIKGPIFANTILADEINRTPPKTQSALLEVMQELQVTVGGKRYKVDEPFFVLATQNPIEQEGTYPLPEAQLDRFMFTIVISYPKPDEEIKIMRMVENNSEADIESVMTREEIKSVQDVVRKIPVSDHVLKYSLCLVLATRKTEDQLELVSKWVQWGAGPRASQFLILAAKANAALSGRYHVSIEDVRKVAIPILRHRIILNFAAEAEGIKSEELIKKLLEEIPDSENALDSHPIISKVLTTV